MRNTFNMRNVRDFVCNKTTDVSKGGYIYDSHLLYQNWHTIWCHKHAEFVTQRLNCKVSLIRCIYFFFITPILNYNLSGFRIISNLNVAKWDVDASSMKEASLSIQ